MVKMELVLELEGDGDTRDGACAALPTSGASDSNSEGCSYVVGVL